MSISRKAVALVASILIVSALSVYWLQGTRNATPNSLHAVEIERIGTYGVGAPLGYTNYVILTRDTNSGSESWSVNSTSFQVISNTSSTYSDDSGSFYGTIGVATIPAHQHQMLELSFQLPSNQTPTRLVYDDQSMGSKTVVDVLPASESVSKFEDITDVTKAGEGNYIIGIVAYAVVLNTTFPSFGSGERVSYTFFSGDRVTVGIVLQYYKEPADPITITIGSVANSEGFHVVAIEPGVPVSMTGWGSRLEIQVTLVAPEQSYSGGLHFVVSFNANTA